MLVASLMGASLGFISAVPVSGPISALVFTQGMRGRYTEARWLGLGASLAESVYAFLAFWGIGQVLVLYPFVPFAANVASGVLLVFLGIYFIRSKKMRSPVASTVDVRPPRGARAFFAGAAICAVNPTLIATWATALATLHSLDLVAFTERNALGFSAGVALGIFAWFALFVRLIRTYRDRFKQEILGRMLSVIGVILLVLGVVLAIRAFKS
jgi:threonine/homoserine/homoserine lactone efflux protein